MNIIRRIMTIKNVEFRFFRAFECFSEAHYNQTSAYYFNVSLKFKKVTISSSRVSLLVINVN